MKMHVDYEWSIRKLKEDPSDESAAGIPLEALVKMGPVPPVVSRDEKAASPGGAVSAARAIGAVGALGRLINLLRRRDRLSLEEAALKAQVDLAELLRIEKEEHYKPRPRTIVQLAGLFKVPVDQLSKIAGLKIAEDPALEQATLKFAAHSEQLTQLSKTERDALNEYLAVLTQRKK